MAHTPYLDLLARVFARDEKLDLTVHGEANPGARELHEEFLTRWEWQFTNPACFDPDYIRDLMTRWAQRVELGLQIQREY